MAMTQIEGRLATRMGTQVWIWCSGCQCVHSFETDKSKFPSWTWNGSLDLPTFRPSYRVQGFLPGASEHTVCHSFVTDGRMQFLADSTHRLSGQTVDLEPVDSW